MESGRPPEFEPKAFTERTPYRFVLCKPKIMPLRSEAYHQYQKRQKELEEKLDKKTGP